ncbi:MAG: hypothetical protein ACI8P9_002279 [Parasphingorhabdus sp.]|jgi:hypothetical protein
MKFNSVVVVTYGRSGSTLLQGMLNSIDGCLIRGENYLFCAGLFQTYESLLKARSNYGDNPRSPWYGSEQIDIDCFLSSCQIMVRGLLVGETDSSDVICYGFKEIRYFDVISKFSEFLSFLEKIFPNVAFVFNTREHTDVLKSNQKNGAEKFSTLAQLQELNAAYLCYCADHDNAFLIDYHDLVEKTQNLENLFYFLGAPYNADKVDQVLATPFSYGQSQPAVLKLKRDSVAMCITIKNEATLLRHNLKYHHNIGVGKVYLYLDGTTDGSEKTISDLDFVEFCKSTSVEKVINSKGWGVRGVKNLRFYCETHLSRQMINMLDAYERATKQGFEWLVCVDADELIYPNAMELRSDSLCELLASYPMELDMINFQPVECLQNKLAYENVVFTEQHFFKSEFTPQRGRNPQVDVFRKEIILPMSQKSKLLPPYLGHAIGKVAVRTSRQLLPATAHKFYHPKREILTGRASFLVHYPLYSAEDFIKKQQNFVDYPNIWLRGGSVQEELLEWIEFVNDEGTTQEQITEYYKSNLMYSDCLIHDVLQLKNSPLLELHNLRDYVRESFEL